MAQREMPNKAAAAAHKSAPMEMASTEKVTEKNEDKDVNQVVPSQNPGATSSTAMCPYYHAALSRSHIADQFIRKLASDGGEKPPLTTNILIGGRYKMLQKIASGSYGNVYKAVDSQNDSLRAVKVIKTKHITRSQNDLIRELGIIAHIFRADVEGSKKHIVQMHHAFTAYSHLFIVFELMGPSLGKVMYENGRRGFSLHETRDISHQLLSGVAFLHRLGIGHHDIKPENIAFLSSHCEWNPQSRTKRMLSLEIRLLDFGSACFHSDTGVTTATTRQYRSPEMGQGCQGRDGVSDIWSVGCTLYETFTGKMLFKCSSERQKCYLMEALFGKIPTSFGLASRLSCFDKEGNLQYDDDTKEFLPDNLLSFQDIASSYEPQNPVGAPQFFDLLTKMLVVEITQRWSAEALLKHCFWEVELLPKSEQ